MATAKTVLFTGEETTNYAVDKNYRAFDKSQLQNSSIPKYSVVNSATFSITIKGSINTSKANLIVAFSDYGGSEGKPNGTVLGNWEKEIGSSKLTKTANMLPYIHSGNVNAGKYNGSYPMLVYYAYHNIVVRKYTLYDVHIDYTFTKPTYNIALAATAGGAAICTANNSTNYTAEVDITDKTVTIKATPQDGYKFIRWSDGNTNATRNITISQNSISATNTTLSLSAIFEKARINNIYIGNKQPVEIYVGNTPVKEIYVGATKVYG